MKIAETIRKYKLLSEGLLSEGLLSKGLLSKDNHSESEPVLVAVSGGADSMALLYGLLEYSPALKLSVCHINHNLRGEESQKDADFVRDVCNDLGIPFFYYEASGLSGQEEEARQVRYSFLYNCAQANGITKIATGHNLNDNAETLILRLCRGTGLSGLGGISTLRRIVLCGVEYSIIRPLIETSRTEIEKYLQEKGISYRTDASNFDNIHARNRVRHEVIPALQKINPRAVENLARSAELLRQDANFLASLNPTNSSTNLDNAGDKRIHIPTMHRRAIHAALENHRNISEKHIIQIESLLTAESGKKLHLPGGLIVSREYEYLLITSNNKQKSEGFCYDLQINNSTHISSIGLDVQISVKNRDITSPINSSEMCTKYFNYDKIIEEQKRKVLLLQLRSRQPGDRIYISGVGHKKLSDEFCDRKIPQSERDSIALLTLGKDVLWIIGRQNESGRSSDAYKPCSGKPMLMVEVNYGDG